MIKIPTNSVSEFLKTLLPTGLQGRPPWFFRGQADATWGLVPSLWRKKSWVCFGGAEQFGLACDNGLVTGPPDEVVRFENLFLDTLKRVIRRMGLPPDLEEDEPLVAFAQHIGLPTRLLDWTRSPWVAAYFAAKDARQFSADTGGALAVYAASEQVLDFYWQGMGKIKRLAVRGAWNPNILAQQGVLIRVKEGNNPDLLEGIEARREQPGYSLGDADTHKVEHQLLRITLSWQHSGELLETLRDQGIHAATLYPGNVGVAELVREILAKEMIRRM